MKFGVSFPSEHKGGVSGFHECSILLPGPEDVRSLKHICNKHNDGRKDRQIGESSAKIEDSETRP